jgi:hypothetical protein
MWSTTTAAAPQPGTVHVQASSCSRVDRIRFHAAVRYRGSFGISQICHLHPPPGSIIVHNHAQPARRLGWRDFRAWLDTLGAPGRAPVEPCPCDWAPELGGHYRVKARSQPGG